MADYVESCGKLIEFECDVECTMRPPKSSFSSTSGGPSSCIERALDAENADLSSAFGASSASESPIFCAARLLLATAWPALSLIPVRGSVVISEIDRGWLTSNRRRFLYLSFLYFLGAWRLTVREECCRM